MNAGRELWTWAAACAAGAGAVLLAAGREWAVLGSAGAGADGAEPPALTGSGIVSFLSPVALAVLAAVVAVLATGGGARRAVGAVIALCGLGVLAGAWDGTGRGALAAAVEANLARAAGGDVALDAFTVRWTWPVVAAAGGLVLLAAGVTAVLRGPRWPGMSGRYDRSQRGPGAGPATERALWDAIDRGADPTDDPADAAVGDRAGASAGAAAGGAAGGGPGDPGAGPSAGSGPAGGPARGER
ncbi:Trp biosynthesis-associated membrane protein [Planomonospora sp. ID82291]|uniref:Trp biosynthesis-associated membrane protein n=1 Tax=Planomonospora sp. ID82291 TaxID=2738136 RepID=UPI0018C424BB|nr:Trp biosynthesis-associated membrane protein [Planomonospora sp. ID82291]MBG0817437.1 Trp biosynthesis-associated membrane protein [Planomonospora sp. ID82291]